jgi:hypothetical protein
MTNKNIYSLGVGISTVLEISHHFLFKGERDHPIYRIYSPISRLAYKSDIFFEANFEVFVMFSPISRYQFSPELVDDFRSMNSCIYTGSNKNIFKKDANNQLFVEQSNLYHCSNSFYLHFVEISECNINI